MGLVDRLKSNVSAKMLFFLNLTAAALVVIAVVVRCLEFGKSKDPFFYVLTLYLILFDAILVATELEVERITKYLSFLKWIRGRGFYILFLACLVLNIDSAVEITFAIAMTLIGLIDICWGGRAWDDH